ncbi:hypothetical protein evm_013386 [Chilo suppressalis]|nr:hypothetical protein evm_013386 [Chilo suppressalis]
MILESHNTKPKALPHQVGTDELFVASFSCDSGPIRPEHLQTKAPSTKAGDASVTLLLLEMSMARGFSKSSGKREERFWNNFRQR